MGFDIAFGAYQDIEPEYGSVIMEKIESASSVDINTGISGKFLASHFRFPNN